MPSAKCPDRFSRSVACNAKPESFLDDAPFEKAELMGEGATGDGGDALDEWLLPVVVELVDGLSLPRLLSPRAVTNALYTAVRELGNVDASPKFVELSLTNCERVDGVALESNICGFSEEKAS
jgi:hypothetical protein